MRDLIGLGWGVVWTLGTLGLLASAYALVTGRWKACVAGVVVSVAVLMISAEGFWVP